MCFNDMHRRLRIESTNPLRLESLEERRLLASAVPESEPNDVLEEAEQVDYLANGEVDRAGDIAAGGDVDLYAVELLAGDTLQASILLDLERINADPDPEGLLLFDGLGQQVAGKGVSFIEGYSTDGPGIFYVGISERRLAVTGYDPTARGDRSGPDAGPYVLRIQVTRNQPPVLQPLGPPWQLLEGQTALIHAGALSVIDADNSPEEIVFTMLEPPSFGQLELTTQPGIAASSFTQADVNADRLVYVHDGSDEASDQFRFRVDDGAGGSIENEMFHIQIDSINDQVPVAKGDSITLLEGSSTSILDSGETSVLDNDEDADIEDPRAALTAVLIDGPRAPNFILRGDGTFTYEHDGEESPSDQFTYYATDGLHDSDSVTVTILITPVNDRPTLSGPLEIALLERSAERLELKGFYEDAETPVESATFAIVSVMNGVTAAIEGHGVLAIEGDAGFSGEGEITIRVTDTGDGPSDPLSTEVTLAVKVLPMEPNNDVSSASPISPNDRIAGAIDTADDIDFFVVTLSEPGLLTVKLEASELEGSDLGANPESELDSFLTLFGSDEQPLLSSDDRLSGNRDAIIRQHLPAGIYYLAASARADTVGTYHLTTDFILATPHFEDIPVGVRPSAVAAGQFNDDNGDGVVDAGDFEDLVVTSRFTDSVFLLMGLGDGSYRGPSAEYPVGNGPAGIVVGDFDKDGDQDVAVINKQSHDLSILLGSRDGAFTPIEEPIPLEIGSNPVAIISGHWNDDNGDGQLDDNDDLDLATANSGTNTVSILLGEGDGSFFKEGLVTVGNYPAALVARDFDGDGNPDLAVVNRNGRPEGDSTQPGSVSLLIGNGDGSFQLEASMMVGVQPTSIAVGDIDEDGHWDLAVANFQSDDVSLLLGGEGRAFDVQPAIRLRDGPPFAGDGDDVKTSLVMHDFDLDGHLDLAIAVSSRLAPYVTVARGLGDGRFEDGHSFLIADKAQGLVVGDFNGDTWPDLASVGDDSDRVSVLLGLGDGRFQDKPGVRTGDQPYGIVAGDFDNDGWTDLATANQGTDNVTVLLGRDDGGYEQGLAYPVGDGPSAIVAGDFNRDGRLDLATANQWDSTVSVLLGRGNGTYETGFHAELLPASGPAALHAADLDNDGHLDVVTVNPSSGSISILRGQGNGTFEESVSMQVSNGAASGDDRPEGLAIGDIDDDGVADLLITVPSSNQVVVFLGNGDGTFREDARLVTGDHPGAIALGDFNHDQWLDLAVANENDGTISVLLGLGDGDIGVASQSLSVGDRPIALIAGDFNGDQLLDLAAVNEGSDDVSILLGSGSGTFGSETRHEVGLSPSSAVTFDVDRDGRLDLAVASALSDELTIWRGGGDGRFLARQGSAPRSSSAPLLLDLNGDGADDSAVLTRSGDILLRLGRVNERESFQPPRIVNLGRPAQAMIALPADPSLLAVIDRQGDTVSLYAVDLDGNAILSDRLSTGGLHSVQIVSGDINGDGRADLLVAHAGSNSVSVFLADANGGWTRLATPIETEDLSPSDLQLLDTSHDGVVNQMLITDRFSGTVDVWENDGAGRFRRTARLNTGSTQAGLDLGPDGGPRLITRDGTAAIAVGDFNEDDRPDVVLASRLSNRIALLLGKDTGGFADPQSLLAGSQPTAIGVGDFNRDLHLDLAVLNEGNSTVSLFLGDGQGHFEELKRVDGQVALGQGSLGKGSFGKGALVERVRFDAGNDPTGLSVHDIDQDGNLDLVLGNALGDVMTLHGTGAPGSVVTGEEAGPFNDFARIGREKAIAVGDIDGDGVDDLIIADQHSDRVYVQGTDHTFGNELDHGSLVAPGAVEIEDLDGDGNLDVVVANRGGNHVLVYLGQNDGGFATAQSFFTGTSPSALSIRDVNGDFIDFNDDRLPDVVVANEGSNDVSVLLSSTHGGEWTLDLGPRLDLRQDSHVAGEAVFGLAPVDTDVGDFDGDGILDMLVTNRDSNNLFHISGVGGGFFDDTHPIVLPTGISPQETLIAEFNGRDGLDIVTVNRGSNDLTFTSGFNTGAPVRSNISSGGIGPVDGIAMELNFDGRSDLIIANQEGGGIAVFLGNENGLSFSNGLLPGELPHPSALALAEFGESDELALVVIGEADDDPGVFRRDTLLASESSRNRASIAFPLLPDGSSLFRSSVTSANLLLGFLSVFVLPAADELGSERGLSSSDGSEDQTLFTYQQMIHSILTLGNELLTLASEKLQMGSDAHTAARVIARDFQTVFDVLAVESWQLLEKLLNSFVPGSKDHTVQTPSDLDRVMEAEELERRSGSNSEAFIDETETEPTDLETTLFPDEIDWVLERSDLDGWLDQVLGTVAPQTRNDGADDAEGSPQLPKGPIPTEDGTSTSLSGSGSHSRRSTSAGTTVTLDQGETQLRGFAGQVWSAGLLAYTTAQENDRNKVARPRESKRGGRHARVL